MNWHPSSWQTKPRAQQVTYPDANALHQALSELSQLPPLVSSWEIETLKGKLAEAAEGRAFLLQGGDCSESFENCRSEMIAGKLKILLKMSLVLIHGSGRKLIRLGRFAGQYAKPRSSDMETRDGVTLPSYRGDLINRSPFTLEDRTPDPRLMIKGYSRSAMTLNFIRALIDGGFADLHHPEQWDLDFVRHSPQSVDFRHIVEAVSGAIHFLETVAGTTLDELNRVDFFTSHEGLHLEYEQAQTRQVPRRIGWYNLTTHLPWIGERTRDIRGAHVEYFRGIANPIGVKIGPRMEPDELLELLEVLDPQREPGRITLIHRFGVKKVEECLPRLIEAVRRENRKVVWCCDPMHGNNITTETGVKTRDFLDILGELERTFEIHDRLGSFIGGVHFELTGENVTECLGGARGLTAEDLGRAYLSEVDPRLNYEQSLEMALLIARRMARGSR